MDNVLVLVRHGESEWNKLNLFTGWKDPDLSQKGVAEARAAGRLLQADGYEFDVAFTSDLLRAQHTLDLMLEELGQTDLPVRKDKALNERDYGDLSGLDKDEARKRWGEEQVHVWRRSYDTRPPGGESLEGHCGARAALLGGRDPARGDGRPQRARLCPWQLPARPHHAARGLVGGGDRHARAGDRGADRVSSARRRYGRAAHRPRAEGVA